MNGSYYSRNHSNGFYWGERSEPHTCGENGKLSIYIYIFTYIYQRRRRRSGWSGQGRTTFQQVVGLRTRRLGQVSHASSSLLCMYAFLVIVPALSSVRLAFYARRRLALRATRQEHLSGCLVFYTSVPPPLNRAHARVIFYLQWSDHFSNAGAASVYIWYVRIPYIYTSCPICARCNISTLHVGSLLFKRKD